jgi:hypothetical protein
MNNPNQPNRIDPTPVRISTNLSIDRQTPKTDFGTRLKSGLENAAGAVAEGAALAAPLVPGGAIISAAVSSVTQMSSGSSSGQAATAVYSQQGMLQVPGTGGGGISTTVDSNVGQPGMGSSVGGSASQLSGLTTGNLAGASSEIARAQTENSRLLQVQVAMQRENQVFTTVSNVLKTRHDTVKNTISNVR